jgi:tetratricopeptide (TPR) repeat protein
VRNEVGHGLELAWERVFTLHRDFPLEMAWVALAVERPRQAIQLAETSTRLFGKGSLSLTVLGLAHAMLKDNARALKFVERALALQPDNAAARQLKATLAGAVKPAPEAAPEG